MVGVPIGTDEYVLERAMRGGVNDGGADHLARCLANVLDKKAAALLATEAFGFRKNHLEGL